MELSSGAQRLFNIIQRFVRRYKRPAFFSQRWLADHFKVTIRTIKRWFAEVVAASFLKVIRRGRKTPHYVPIVTSNVTSNVTSEPRSNKEVFDFKVLNNPMGRDLNSKTVESIQAPSVSQKGSQMQPMNVGYTEDFQEYIGVFRNAQKPLNEFDYRKAFAVWGGYDIPLRQKATKHAKELAADLQKRGANPKYLPFPVNHLMDQPWTRTVEVKAESVDDEYERYGYRRLGS